MSTKPDYSEIGRANNYRKFSCPFCEFEGTVSERVSHLLDHD